MGPESLYEYDLFAVICHEGGIDNGHYTNFARFEDEVRCQSYSTIFRFLTIFCRTVVSVQRRQVSCRLLYARPEFTCTILFTESPTQHLENA